jgi:hypothetical protein
MAVCIAFEGNDFPDDNGEADPQTVFDEFDLNGDGELDITEFANVWTDFCAEKCHAEDGSEIDCLCDGVNYEDVFRTYDDSDD